jgi:transcriptional regulator with XRE-family HTH domain
MTDRRIKPKTGSLSGRGLLAQWLVRHRMTQAEAADQIGISRVKLNQYLTAEARPSLETAIRIEDATGIGVRLWLLEDPAAELTVSTVTNGESVRE